MTSPLISLTDEGNARLFADTYQHQARYVPDWRRWMLWDGKRWAEDHTEQVRQLAHEVAHQIAQGAIGTEDDKLAKAIFAWGRRSLGTNQITNMLRDAQGMLATRAEQWDADPDVMSCANCDVFLSDARLLEAGGVPALKWYAEHPDKRLLITRQAHAEYDPAQHGACPQFDEFLDTIFDGNAELIRYVWRALGYSITGRTDEQCLFICYGTGANGKSTLFNVVRDVLGEYATHTATETLLKKRPGAIPNDVARLRGARFVTASEADKDRGLDEALVKQLTGGDAVLARFMRAEWFEFKPVCKLWLGVNHRPEIQGQDNGIWRRIHLIPFRHTIPPEQQDRRLEAKLLEERHAIFTRLVGEAVAWAREGLRPPADVVDAVGEYRESQDPLAGFLVDFCELDREHSISPKALFEAYGVWAGINSEQALSQKNFKAALEARGITQRKSGSKRMWLGITTSQRAQAEMAACADAA